jgi:hypothetical protein
MVVGIIGKTIKLIMKEIRENIPESLMRSGKRKIWTEKVEEIISLMPSFAGIQENFREINL